MKELYPLYETALLENDVDTLMKMFWSSPEVMRFGVSENLYGIAELEALRKRRPSMGLTRTVKPLDIVVFGKDVGSVTLEFERNTADGSVIQGRQSQNVSSDARRLAHRCGAWFSPAVDLMVTSRHGQ